MANYVSGDGRSDIYGLKEIRTVRSKVLATGEGMAMLTTGVVYTNGVDIPEEAYFVLGITDTLAFPIIIDHVDIPREG